MHNGPTKLLENNTYYANLDIDGRFHLRSTGLDYNNNAKIEEAIIANKDNKNKEENFRKKNK